VNVVAVSTPPRADWRWRIVDSRGDTLEESSSTFATIALAMAAGTARLQHHVERDRPLPARVPWHRRR
jgi:hypothetical protein